jgi:hypothetical protein
MVKAEVLTPEALLAALKAGDFYASQGPELHHVEIKDDHLILRCSAVDRVTVLGPRARSVTLSGTSMTRANLPLTTFQGDWLRVVVIDAAGKRAWSNPVPTGVRPTTA